MSRRRTVRSLAALAVVLGVVASGCTEPSAKPKPLPSRSDTASTSASPTPTPPELPPEASGTSAASAKAFARFYVDLINYSSRTGDTEPLINAGDQQCRSCDAIARNIDRIYTSGGSIKSEGWQLQSVALVPQQPRSRPILDLGLLQSPEVVVRSSDGPTKHFGGGKQPMTMYLEQSGQEWHVRRLDLVS